MSLLIDKLDWFPSFELSNNPAKNNLKQIKIIYMCTGLPMKYMFRNIFLSHRILIIKTNKNI